MSALDAAAAGRDLARRTRARQALPRAVEDPAALARIASLLDDTARDPPRAA